MKKDLRNRDALRRAPELAEVANSPAFDDIDVVDLRKLAELLRDYADGSLDRVTVETAAAFGGTSRHRFQCVQRALRGLVGEDCPATKAVCVARNNLADARRGGGRQKDHRSREAILLAPRWDPFRELETLATMPVNELRAVDRFLAFCAEQGLPGGEVEDFLAFVDDKDSSMLLRTVRDGLEKLLTLAHPAVAAAERARSLKEGERTRRRRPHQVSEPTRRPLTSSVAPAELPAAWREVFDTLLAGKRLRGRTRKEKSVQNMSDAARQLLWASRGAGLEDEISLDTIRAYDLSLEARGTRASSRGILFSSLYWLAWFLRLEEDLLGDILDLAGHYHRMANQEVKLKEGRLADLPDLQKIFDKANGLLDQAATTSDRRNLTTLYIDAAALALLSLVPLRNKDTILFWGRQIVYIGDDDPGDWGLDEQAEPPSYYLDLRTSKTGSGLSGPLAPILTPFLDALILRGQDDRLLPELRRQVMASRAPVFPTSGGKARSERNLSDRWRAQLGTGSIISRTRVHTLLGTLGEHGVRAALALCAQRSPRTAKWYQAEALGRRRMLGSQEMITGLIDMSDDEESLLASLDGLADMLAAE